MPIELDRHVFGRFIKLEFIGKPCVQELDSKYYIAIARIRFYGGMYNLDKCQQIENFVDVMCRKNSKYKQSFEEYLNKLCSYFDTKNKTDDLGILDKCSEIIENEGESPQVCVQKDHVRNFHFLISKN